MNYKGIGSIFCLISAILLCARHITAAIFISNSPSWNAELYQNALNYIGPHLLIFSVIALVAGILFLVFGTFKDTPKK